MAISQFKIVLLVPPRILRGDLRDLRDDVLDHKGLASLTAVLEQAGFPVEYLNADLLELNSSQVCEILCAQTPPALVGFTVIEDTVEIVCELSRMLRSQGFTMPFLAGGFFPTLAPHEMMEMCPELDYCIRGEAEKSCLALCRCLAAGEDPGDIPGLVYRQKHVIQLNPQQVVTLDTLPQASQKYLPYLRERGGSGYVMTSRGCFSNCAFCSIKGFYQELAGPAWRKREVTRFVDEIETLNQEWGQHIIPIWDDNFLSGKQGKKRAAQFINEIAKRKLHLKFFINCRVDDVDESLFADLKEIGLYKIGMGIESLIPEHLRFYGKGVTAVRNRQAISLLDTLEFRLYLSFILFNPFTTCADLQFHLDFFKERLSVEAGPGYQNLLLPTVSVLGLINGARLLKNPDVQPLLVRDGFRYTYRMQDPKAALFMKLILQLSTLWWPAFIRLKQMEHFVFEPFFIRESHPPSTAQSRMYHELWKSLAVLHLNSYRALLDTVQAGGEFPETVLENFCLELNFLQSGLDKLWAEKEFDCCRLKYRYYLFSAGSEEYCYDIDHSHAFRISELEKQILPLSNYYTETAIVQHFTNQPASAVKAALTRLKNVFAPVNTTRPEPLVQLEPARQVRLAGMLYRLART